MSFTELIKKTELMEKKSMKTKDKVNSIPRKFPCF